MWHGWWRITSSKKRRTPHHSKPSSPSLNTTQLTAFRSTDISRFLSFTLLKKERTITDAWGRKSRVAIRSLSMRGPSCDIFRMWHENTCNNRRYTNHLAMNDKTPPRSYVEDLYSLYLPLVLYGFKKCKLTLALSNNTGAQTRQRKSPNNH